MTMNKENLINLLNQLNETAQHKVLSNDEIIEFETIMDEIELQKKQIYNHLNQINALQNIEDFNWDFSKMNVSLDNSNLVIKQLAKIYLDLQDCIEKIQNLNVIVLKLGLNYTSSDKTQIQK